MKRFGPVTFRWQNGFDLVPSLPPQLPGMSGAPFVQLPAEATLWRTVGGACLKATAGLLVDCPAPAAVEAAEAAGLAGEGEDEEAGKAAKKDGKRARGREERCSYVVGDHRLYKALGALGRCVAAEARARGDACMPQVVEAILPKKASEEAAGR
jgi:hypothetical protein